MQQVNLSCSFSLWNFITSYMVGNWVVCKSAFIEPYQFSLKYFFPLAWLRLCGFRYIRVIEEDSVQFSKGFTYRLLGSIRFVVGEYRFLFNGRWTLWLDFFFKWMLYVMTWIDLTWSFRPENIKMWFSFDFSRTNRNEIFLFQL